MIFTDGHDTLNGMVQYAIDEQLKENELVITLSDFKDSYNEMLPEGFPQTSTTLLKQFQNAHLSLFRDDKKCDKQWSLVKHRKKVMDWLLSNRL